MCAPKVKSPDTSKQEAEAARQREIEQQRYEALLAENRRISDEQRAASERQAAEQRDLLTGQLTLNNLAATRAENQRRDADQAAADEAERQRQQAAAEAAVRTGNAKAYAEGRTAQINNVTSGINEAYAGFDDGYFDNFSKQYIDYYTPQIGEQFKDARDKVIYKYANQGGLQSTAANDDLADLIKKRRSAEGKISQDAAGAASGFRSDIDNQKRALLGEALSAVNIGSEILPDGVSDVNGAISNISQRLQPYATMAKSRAGSVAAPTFSDMGSLFGDLTSGSDPSGSGGSTYSNINSDGIYQPRSGSSVRVVV